MIPLDTFVEVRRDRSLGKLTRLIHRRTGRVLITANGTADKQALLRSLRVLSPAPRDESYERWSEDLDATLPAQE